MRTLFTFSLVIGISLAGFAQKADSTKTTKITLRGLPTAGTEPLIVIDGNKQYVRGASSLSEVEPNNIESVTILKDSLAATKYGPDGFAGVIEVKTKNGSLGNYGIKNTPMKPVDLNLNGKTSISARPINQPIIRRYLLNRDFDPKAKPLYVVDGKEVTDPDLKEASIKSIAVLKDSSATTLYGDRGKNGVVIITTKKATAKKN
jgi:TonB-dependent SusC/RagA subfamily outer membrane receptor